MGCATLTKGPVGILLPCMVTGVFLLIRGTSFFKAFFSMALVAITSCILPALWYIAAYQQGGDNFISLVMEENFVELVEREYDKGGQHHVNAAVHTGTVDFKIRQGN